jgi:hypothetical protein
MRTDVIVGDGGNEKKKQATNTTAGIGSPVRANCCSPLSVNESVFAYVSLFQPHFLLMRDAHFLSNIFWCCSKNNSCSHDV